MPTRSVSCGLGSLVLVTLLLAPDSFARQVSPAVLNQTRYSVQQGSEARIFVDGINLEKASSLLFSHPGLSGRIAKHRSLPYPPKQPGELGEDVVRTEYMHDGSTKDRLQLVIRADESVPPRDLCLPAGDAVGSHESGPPRGQPLFRYHGIR